MNLRHEIIPLNRRYGALAIHERLPRLFQRRLRIHGPLEIPAVEQAYVEKIPPSLLDINTTLEEATVDLVKFLSANAEHVGVSLMRLRRGRLCGDDPRNAIWEVVRYINEHVFMGRLTDRVNISPYARAKSLLSFNDSGKTLAVFTGQIRAELVFNFDAFQHLFSVREDQQAHDYVIAAIIHQMIHAYFIVSCGPQDQEKKANELLTHDEHFGVVLHKIKSMAKGLPLDFGDTMPRVHGYHGHRNEGDKYLLARSEWADRRKIVTECARDVRTLKEEECKHWYKDKCLKALDPDIYVYHAASRSFVAKPASKCGNKNDWVEIYHKKKAYKVAKKTIERFSSLKNKIEDSRTLEVSSDLRTETFEEFICFLCDDADDYSMQELCLITCIELYQLAMGIKFEELKDFALDAMYADGRETEHVNPNMDTLLQVLRTVYKASAAPDKHLRSWTTDFMKRLPPSFLKYAQKDPRVSRLRAISAHMRQDLDKVLRVVRPIALTAANAMISPRIDDQGISPSDTSGNYMITSQAFRHPRLVVAATSGMQSLSMDMLEPQQLYPGRLYPEPVSRQIGHLRQIESPQLIVTEIVDDSLFAGRHGYERDVENARLNRH